jgi:hypothetical protein
LSPDDLRHYLGNKRDRVIILGADVTQPTHGDVMGFPSIAYVVRSIDDQFQNYLGLKRLQGVRVEVSIERAIVSIDGR